MRGSWTSGLTGTGSREAGRNGRCRSGLGGGGGISVGPGTAPPVSESPQKWLLAIVLK
jgi:hypothetical protein